MSTPNLIAGGNIVPSRFVKLSAVANNTALQATDGSSSKGDLLIGISQEGGREAPIPSVSTVYAAQAADPVHIYGLGEECLLELGSGGCTAGDRLKSDANGKGIVASAAGDNYGARALSTASAAELVRVQVIFGLVP